MTSDEVAVSAALRQPLLLEHLGVSLGELDRDSRIRPATAVSALRSASRLDVSGPFSRSAAYRSAVTRSP